MLKYALIVAGGKGLRMGSEMPKQFINLNGTPVLMHTLRAFAVIENINLILVLPQDQVGFWETLCNSMESVPNHQIVVGGPTRFHSVSNGLMAIPEPNSLVAIHDGVRPMISKEIIENGFETAQLKGNSVVVVPLKDSLRKQELLENHSVNRANYYLVQTPQTFQTNILLKAYQNASHDNFTDDASVIEEVLGDKINMITGSYQNIKITTPEDLLVAEVFLRNK
ncbi:MAG: 2-C-methyl-D-erythritol 4-phosphate cytidylyltransferase [Bacteroidetes bacterium B1(2017)]|nr:MAG: 2-C-methyl-D-erythritol 4-phosphate cytidylyltransferase [Bacteroidetes bacterium B1(2017)]